MTGLDRVVAEGEEEEGGEEADCLLFSACFLGKREEKAGIRMSAGKKERESGRAKEWKKEMENQNSNKTTEAKTKKAAISESKKRVGGDRKSK